jgi:hypothetical protein
LLFEGVWKSHGYGWILKIDSEGYALFDITPDACIEFERGTSTEFEVGFDLLAQDHEDHLALCVRHDITRYDFDRVTALPANTLYLDAPRRTGLRENLDFFCGVFAQDYAFFDLRGVAWDEACVIARSKIRSDSNPGDLFRELHALIKPLGDNHVILSDGERIVSSEGMAEIKSLVQDELGLGSASIGDLANIARIGPFINNEFLDGTGSSAGNGVINWGMIRPGVGYLNVLKLFGLADTEEAETAIDLPPRRANHARFLRNDLDAIEVIMDQVMSDLGQARSIILDIRLNGGGFDNVGMAIANRFTEEKRLAFTKHARNGSGVTPTQEFFIQPAGDFQFTRPVYVLTSGRTASAGDIFAMCMRNLPHVTLVGQSSTGILSDNLKKHLPNGWTTSISNEFYCSSDGKLFEGPGIPVDVETPVFVINDFKAGYHIAVDKALELAMGNEKIVNRQ